MKNKLEKFFLAALPLSSSDRLNSVGDKAGYINKVITPATLIVNVISYVLGFVGLIFLAMIIYSGVQMIIAGGNDQVIEEAKTRLKNAVLGFAIVASAYAILLFVGKVILQIL